MAFPDDPLDLVCELHLGGDWVDVTEDVRVDGGDVVIRRGRSSQDTRTPPARATWALDNKSGDYSPRNPVGAYYGSIGRNTPARLCIRPHRDEFARTVTDGWGSTDTGAAWLRSGVGHVPADWAVTPGMATHAVSATSTYRVSYLGSVSYRDVEVVTTVTMPADVTGGDLEPANIVLRGIALGQYYLLRVVVTAAEAVTMRAMHADGTTYGDAVTVPGLTHTGSLRVRAQMEGETLRGRVWDAAEGEPADWQLTAHVPGSARAGWVGIRSGVASGNTNIPVTFGYSDVEVRRPRFVGEISTWPPRWDTSGADAWVNVEASGVTRRLGQGAPVLSSAMRRSTLGVGPVAYWPCEDGTSATTIGSGLPDHPAMTVMGEVRPGSASDFVCSTALPVLGAGWLSGAVPPYDGDGSALQLRFLMRVSSTGLPVNDAILARIYTSGSGPTAFWQLVYVTGGGLRLEAWASETVLVGTSGVGAFDVDGELLRVSVELQQSGADTTWRMAILGVGATVGAFTSGTIAGQVPGIATQVWVGCVRLLDLGSTVIGHVTVQDEITDLFDLHAELTAYSGERALTRIERLCAENGIPLAVWGVAAESSAMGPQGSGTLAALLTECAEADLGTLYEPKGELGIAYRTRSSLYGQPPTATLDYDAGHVAAPYEPEEDDRYTRNDVTVRRSTGSEARAEQLTGRMSVLSPAEGGVGRYDSRVEVNVADDTQLVDTAWWLVHLGTVDEPRFPAITANLATLATLAPDVYDQVQDLDVDDRLTVANTALHSHYYGDVEQLARGYTEVLGTYRHRITVNGAPASPYRVLALDGSAEASRLDSDATTLAEDLDSTETDMTVDIEAGALLWTTDPADLPFDVEVGGEVVSVTAVTGSGPQVFTVARSVNGVVKAHSAGADIRLARPNYLGL